MESHTLTRLAVVLSMAYGLMFVFVDVNSVAAVIGALLVGAMWVFVVRENRQRSGATQRRAQARAEARAHRQH